MLVELLEKDAVPLSTLEGRYGSLLQLVRTLIGVVPNCDAYLEIWPPAFRSYNVMVPNLLNLPFLIWGLGVPRSTLGLALYVSSRAAGCPYCSAHTCSFALRRGATVDEVAAALDDAGRLSPPNRAAVQVARALSVVPATIREEERRELLRHFSAAHAEWIVLGIGMMGWLNKTMDALGVPLEPPTVAEVNGVIARSGWTPGQHLKGTPPTGEPARADSIATRLSVVRYAPAALKLDKEWTAGVPDRWPAVGEFLREKTGHSFPLLSRLQHRRAIRAIATMIKDNLGPGLLERESKLAAGLIFARTVQNAPLGEGLIALGAGELPDSPLLRLAKAISTSPAAVNEGVVESSRAIPPAQLVELVTFVALLQLLHRISSFYPA